MSYMKRRLENSIGSISDEELRRYGYQNDEIRFMRESFEGREYYEETNMENQNVVF